MDGDEYKLMEIKVVCLIDDEWKLVDNIIDEAVYAWKLKKYSHITPKDGTLGKPEAVKTESTKPYAWKINREWKRFH